MAVLQSMTTQEEIAHNIKLYAERVDGLKTDPDRYDTWALLALLTRDDIHENWRLLSKEQIGIVSKLDDKLRLLKDDVSLTLPSANSTPQARAEGRWWWFLNER